MDGTDRILHVGWVIVGVDASLSVAHVLRMENPALGSTISEDHSEKLQKCPSKEQLVRRERRMVGVVIEGEAVREATPALLKSGSAARWGVGMDSRVGHA